MERLHRVKGTRDLYPPEAELKEWVEKKAKKFLRTAGFKPITTPTFEFTELYLRSTGISSDVVNKEMYTFKDKKGRLLTLRPEGTPGVLRAVIENNLKLPSRFYYIAPMYRQEKPQKGRLREHWQIGAEVIGESEPYVDAELIYIACSLLEELGAKNFYTEINSIGCKNCREDFKKEFLKFVKGKENLLCKDCKIRLERNPLRVFDCKNSECQKIYEKAPKICEYLCDPCKSHFEEVKKGCRYFGVNFSINPKLVRGFDYYTKTVFELKSKALGAQNTVLAGGRYDNLMEDLGAPPAPAIGFALGEERVMLIIKRKEELKKAPCFALLPLGEEAIKKSIDILKNLRKEKIQCIADYSEKKLRSKLKRVDKRGIDYAIIFGEDELKNNILTVKKMSTGEQWQVKNKNLIAFLKEKI